MLKNKQKQNKTKTAMKFSPYDLVYEQSQHVADLWINWHFFEVLVNSIQTLRSHTVQYTCSTLDAKCNIAAASTKMWEKIWEFSDTHLSCSMSVTPRDGQHLWQVGVPFRLSYRQEIDRKRRKRKKEETGDELTLLRTPEFQRFPLRETGGGAN